ncbi:CHASE2 domain-containing sensor protein [Agrobacterium larrymoorei]|uniref:CHASE2 domain-containing sensor protein n=1 Tax=Agrobacterium larrymoorei TaxID=160699 RepID=A0AAJ2B6Z2_9HYPH|nr:hypothetical protein [Agrobacterium larrymoorei]MDR6100501.1 CHASE2 domain-containing sensor protein [Agrobacterium larrymoorei]
MKHCPIIAYEPARHRDPFMEAVFTWFLGLAFGWFILYSAVAWMWAGACDVIRHPFAAPLYTLFVCAVWLSVGALVLWAVWRALLIAWRVARATLYLIEDVAYSIAARFERLREVIGRMGGRR